MDKTVLKNFAIESRKDLMEKIDRKIKLFYVDEDFKKENRGDVIVLSNDKHTLTLTKEEDSNRDKLLRRIAELGYNQVVEEASYTWFNRIIAIRYMEVNDYLPLTRNNLSLGLGVFSSKDNTLEPDIIKFSNLLNPELDINFNKEIYSELKDTNSKFKYILMLICNKLKTVIPNVFGGQTDYIDLLVLDNMLAEGGIINKLINSVSLDNFKSVEVIGWLYQYYNQEEKNRVINAKKTYKKSEIAYATQIFTPDWIVKYMVENTLGRFWIENNSTDYKYLSNDWKYYIDEEYQKTKSNIDPTEITFIDPCSGSGHILVYAFEIFVQIYESAGYSTKDIPELILKNNLYGLDIDDRAGQLSNLSVILKAREYDQNIFNKDIIKNMNIVSLKESNEIDTSYFDQDLITNSNIDYLIKTFRNAKEIGSLLKVEHRDYSYAIEKLNSNLLDLSLFESIKPLIKQANILSKKYSVVVTNPPYINNSLMPIKLKDYMAAEYSGYNWDTFACFSYRDSQLLIDNGLSGIMCPTGIMFLSSFYDLRKYIIDNLNIVSFVQLAKGSFFSEASVDICSYIVKKSNNCKFGNYIRLEDYKNDMDSQSYAFMNIIKSKAYFNKNQEDFKKIELYPFSYWISEKTINTFTKGKLGDLLNIGQGLKCGDTPRFIRSWFEIDSNKIGDNSSKDKKWFYIANGGEFRKWYGNLIDVVNWENDGYEIKNFKDSNGKLRSRLQNMDYYFSEGLTWSALTSKALSVRYCDNNCIYGGAGYIINSKDHKMLKVVLGFLNSSVQKALIKVLSETLNFEVGNLKRVPMMNELSNNVEIIELVDKNIEISKLEWNSYEISNSFKTHPLIEFKSKEDNGLDYHNWNYKIEDAFNLWKIKSQERFNIVKNNEERLNQIFIEAYGLENEITSKVDENEITLRVANEEKDIKSLISYAVGCMFGRYSLDNNGLIYAGGDFDKNKYKTFIPDNDNIIPISDNENVYYNDDIVGRFKDFIGVAFGKNSLNENLDYIAEVLGKRGTESSEDAIRRYFINDFYNDHLKIYQKRPIYWLFDSGKKNGFKCLIYLHRYDEQIVSKIRTKYLHNTIAIYQRNVEEIDYELNNENLNTTDKRKLQSSKVDLNSKITECNEYEEKVGNVANKMIKLDLDDGVVVNYAKFIDDNGKSILTIFK